MLDCLDKTASWVIDRHFDVLMTLVVETRSWLEAGEELFSDLESWLYRQQQMIS